MRNIWIVTLCSAACLSLLALPGPASAQVRPPGPGFNPSARPAFSPYLNLLRRDINPAINYFGIVRPELAFNRAIQDIKLQQNYLGIQQDQLATSVNALGSSAAVPPTGTPAGFMTQSKYFLNNRGGKR